MKICTRCGYEQPKTNFHKDKHRPDGLAAACKPCVASYSAKRWARDKAGLSLQHKKWRIENPEKLREGQKRWCALNPDRVKATKQKTTEKNKAVIQQRIRQWRADNPEKSRASSRRWGDLNPEAKQAYQKQYYAQNRAYFFARNGQRRAITKMATPSWASLSAISAFYVTAQGLNMLLGDWHHVDHIVPLISKLVCGLHCEANLQILTAKENAVKNNRFWPDMPDKEN